MFSTSGYFKDIPCPFYEHGLCHRPYCHYKHAKKSKDENDQKDDPTPSISTSSDQEQHLITDSSPSCSQAVKGRSPSPVTDSTTLEDIFGLSDEDDDDLTQDQIYSDPLPTSPNPIQSCPDAIQSSPEPVQRYSDMIQTSPDPLRISPDPVQSSPDPVQSSPDQVQSFPDPLQRYSDVLQTSADQLQRSPDPVQSYLDLGQSSLDPVLNSPDPVQRFSEKSPGPAQTSLDISMMDSTCEDLTIPTVPQEKNIMDEYTSRQPSLHDDDNDVIDVGDCASPMEESQLLQEKFKEATTKNSVIFAENEGEKEDKYKNKGIKKKRLAHSNEKIVRDPGYVTRALMMKEKATGDEKLKEAIRDPTAVYTGKKRKSHVNESSQIKKGTQSRPKLPITINAKIPTKIRQQFLDSFIDEFIKMGVEPTEGYSKALDKEKELFEQCSSTMIYKSRAALELRNLRKMAEQELMERKERSDKRVRDQMSPTTPTSNIVKKKKMDVISKDSKSKEESTSPVVDKRKHPIVKNSDSKNVMVPIKSILSNTKEKSPFDLPPPADLLSSLAQSNDGKSKQSKAHKIIPLKFYSDKNKIKQSSEDASDGSSSSSSGVYNMLSDHRKLTGKRVEEDFSFEAALGKGGSNKKKLMKNKKIKVPEPLYIQSSVNCESQGTEKDKKPTLSTNTTMINLSQLRNSSVSLTTDYSTKKTKRVLDSKPPVQRPHPTFSILSKKEIKFNGDIFYSRLQKYLLSEEQLIDNGYPRPTSERGMVSIKRETIIEPVPVESLGSNAMRHKCCRCGQNFIIYNRGEYQSVEECTYHYSKLIKSREYGEGVISKYRCCGQRQGSPGCQVALMHVTAGILLSTEKGYIVSLAPPDEGYTPQVYSLDCEMVYTTIGLQLARITVINMERKTVLESLINPSHTIVDYNTRFSGLTGKDFVNVKTSLEDLHKQLQCLIYSDTILIGHSLESDLNSIKLVHSKVVDTAIVFPHRKGLPFKRGLKELMAEQLKKFIQDNIEGGHDSREDAEACMDLMIMKVKNDLQADTRRKST